MEYQKISSSSIYSIKSGLIVTFFGKIINSVLGFLNIILIARILNVNDFGLYSVALTILNYFYVISNAGLDNTLLSLIPKRKKQGEKYLETIVTSFGFILTSSVIVTAGIFAINPYFDILFGYTYLSDFLTIMSFTIIIQSLIMYSRVINQANFSYIRSNIPENILRPTLFFVLLSIILYLNKSDYRLVIWSYLLSYLIAFIFSIFWGLKTIQTYKDNRISLNSKITRLKHIIFYPLSNPLAKPLKNRSNPLLRNMASGLDREVFRLSPQFLLITLINQSGPFFITIIMGLHLAANDLGFFRASQQTTTLISFTLASLTIVFAPIFSSLFAKGNLEELRRMYQQVTKWTLAAGGLICIVMIVGSDLILSLFGREFVETSYLLKILALGHLINSSAGICGNILLMTGNQKRVIWANIIGLIVSVLLCWFIIPKFGLLGGGASVTLGMWLYSIILVYEVWKRLSFHPFSNYYWGTVISLIFSAAITYFCNSFFQSLFWFWNLTLISVVATISFICLFCVFGVDMNERSFIKNKIKI